MKKVSTLFGVPVLIVACLLSFSSVNAQSYSIQLQSKVEVGTGEEWTWVLTNPSPGNGDNGTLQDVSHWSMSLTASAEGALMSVQYSRDGNNWHTLPVNVDRDPSIRVCTNADVLKYDVSTTGTDPVYYKATFNKKFEVNNWATSWIKTGGGKTGCNLYFFPGPKTARLD